MNSTQSEPKTCANNVKCADNDYKLSNHIKRTAYERNATMLQKQIQKRSSTRKRKKKLNQIKKDDDKGKSGNEKSAASSSNMV